MDSQSSTLESLQGAYQAAPESRIFGPLGDAYRRAGRIDEAVHVLELGMSRHPHYVSALVLLALCQLDLGRTADAEASLGRVLALDPENLVAIKHRATRAVRNGTAEEAEAAVELALGIDPYDTEAQQLRDAVRALRLAPPPAPAAAPPPPAPPASALPPAPPVAAPSPSVLPSPQPAARETPVPFTMPAPPVPDWSPPVPVFEEPTAPSPISTSSRDESEWLVHRDADRIVVRPREDSAELGTPARSGAGRADELSTLTLARIYESQGYFDKALAIYDDLERKHPGNAEIETRRRALRERIQAQQPPPAEAPAAPSSAETPRWRLLDAESLGVAPPQTAEHLHQLADAVRTQSERQVPAVPNPPAERPAATVADGMRREEPDFERFLRYVRSLKREG